MAAIAATALASSTRLAGGSAARATAPRRTPLLAPARPRAGGARRAGGGGLGKLAVRAQPAGKGEGEPEDLESLSFQGLAGLVANKIAEAYKGHERELSGSRLAKWLEEASGLGEAAQKAGDAAGQAAKATGVTGVLKKAASVAAAALGGREQEPTPSKPWQAAAHYLGADTLPLSADSLASWITSPKRKDDAKVVGALLMRMLQYYEKQTGESWEGRDHQVSWLWHLSQELLGGGMSLRLVKSLVTAYMRVASR